MRRNKSKFSKVRNWVEENSIESINFIKESRSFIYGSVVIFFLFTLVGFYFPAPESIVEQISKHIQELIERTRNLSHFGLIEFIFFNNIQASFFAMIFGIIFGILPIFILIINGYLLGFVALLSVNAEGFIILWRLLPHGIFELPAIFISTGLGIRVGSFIFQKDKLNSLQIYLKKSLITFLLIVTPLLVIAAIIEGTLIAFS